MRSFQYTDSLFITSLLFVFMFICSLFCFRENWGKFKKKMKTLKFSSSLCVFARSLTR